MRDSINEKNAVIKKILPIAVIVILALLGCLYRVPDDADSTDNFAYSEVKSEAESELCFRNDTLRTEHYEKHGMEMGFGSAEEYEAAARAVVMNPDALHKLEEEDNDDVYYLESTNEFVIVSTDGYIRTYFCPNDGKDYFDRQ